MEWLANQDPMWVLLIVASVIFGPILVGSWISTMRRRGLENNPHRMDKWEYVEFNKRRSDR